MSAIRRKPVSYVRFALVTPTLTTPTTGVATSGDTIPVIEPKLSKEAKLIDYKIVQDTRYSQLKKNSFMTVKVATKHPFILPKLITADGSGGTEGPAMINRYCTYFLDKMLNPAGMEYTTISVGVSGYTLNENWQDGYKYTRIYLQELYDTNIVDDVLTNYKLVFSTQSGCTIEQEWQGLDGGITTNVAASGILAQFPYEDNFNGLPEFEYAEMRLAPVGTDLDALNEYLACSEFNFDMGNKVQFYDDCNGEHGVSGTYIGNMLDGQKVSFNVAAPFTHGSSITTTSYPYWKYFDEGSVMVFKLRMYGNKTKATGGYDSGVDITGQFQLTDVPDKSEANDLRRLKLGGIMYKSDTKHAFTIEPFYDAA